MTISTIQEDLGLFDNHNYQSITVSIRNTSMRKLRTYMVRESTTYGQALEDAIESLTSCTECLGDVGENTKLHTDDGQSMSSIDPLALTVPKKKKKKKKDH